MRVLHVDSGREMRGGQRQVLRLAAGLGAEQTVLCPAESPLFSAAQRQGLQVEPLNLWSLASLARRSEILHAHDARSHTWAAAVAPPERLVVARRVAFAPSRSVVSRWKYQRPRMFIAVSQFVKQTLLDAEVPEERVTVVFDGVDVPDVPAHGDRIVAPATADPAKGSALVREAARLGGFEVCFSDNLERDLPGAALMVYVTHAEGLGSAALLAMAYGVPVVASAVGGLPEVVEDGVTGYLTENDAASIGAAVDRALRARTSQGAAARARVLERFTTTRMVEETRRVYGSLI